MKDTVKNFTVSFVGYINTMAPRQLYLTSVYWSALLLGMLIIVFTGYHIQTIPAGLQSAILQNFEKRPWLSASTVVDGRDIYLIGEVEPDSGIQDDIDRISKIDGVRSISNLLVEQPKPSPYFTLIRNNDKLIADGLLSGADLDTVMDQIETSFADQSIKDKIRIDDRVGKPLWIAGFKESLEALTPISNFELSSWRDQIDLAGYSEDASTSLLTGYSFAAPLMRQVYVSNRLVPKTAPGHPVINIISDWRRQQVTGEFASKSISNKIMKVSESTFGSDQIKYDFLIDPTRLSEHALSRVIALIPVLGQVRDLHLQSSGTGYVVWGQVDNPFQLGTILDARNYLGLGRLVSIRIEVAPAVKTAAVALFSDGKRLIVNGKLPTIKSKQVLLSATTQMLRTSEVIDFISIEPGIAYSKWIPSWTDLLSVLPLDVMGITIEENNLLLTGNADNQAQLTNINAGILKLFPDYNIRNWITYEH